MLSVGKNRNKNRWGLDVSLRLGHMIGPLWPSVSAADHNLVIFNITNFSLLSLTKHGYESKLENCLKLMFFLVYSVVFKCIY